MERSSWIEFHRSRQPIMSGRARLPWLGRQRDPSGNNFSDFPISKQSIRPQRGVSRGSATPIDLAAGTLAGGRSRGGPGSIPTTPNDSSPWFAPVYPTKVASRFDPEDVVQSVYCSFFSNARDNRYVLRTARRPGVCWSPAMRRWSARCGTKRGTTIGAA